MPIQRITSRVIEDGIIAAADIADGSITTAKIADANVTTDKIVTVANTKIAGLVTTAQLAGSITSDKITSVANTAITGLINTAQIADAAITSAKIANNSIITEDIVDRAITAVKIANTAVTAGVYGGSSNSALITVDAQGRITAASNVTASGYSGPQGLQVFNTPGTFTLPPGITAVKVTVIGGGGSGSYSGGEGSVGSSGGFAGNGTKLVTGLTGPVAVTVGTGGPATPVVNGGGAVNGNPGNASSFGPFITANGGSGANLPAVGTPGTTSGPNVFDNLSSAAYHNFRYITPQENVIYIDSSLSKGTGGAGVGPNNTRPPTAAGGAGQVIVEY
jgi:hypothetical protein